jgi:ATP/maltotriose-dependent transcriptional regulator MalT
MSVSIAATDRFKKPDLKKILCRSRLRNCLLDRQDRKVVLIHGRAGQGRSSLVSEFLEKMEGLHLWYALCEEDHDPFLLLENLRDSLPGSQNEQSSPCKDDTLFNSLTCFIKSLENSFSEETYLVLD